MSFRPMSPGLIANWNILNQYLIFINLAIRFSETNTLIWIFSWTSSSFLRWDTQISELLWFRITRWLKRLSQNVPLTKTSPRIEIILNITFPLNYFWVTVMLATSLCWWLYNGDWFEMLVAESLCWWLFSLCWWFSQCIKSVTNISNLSPTHCVSNIIRQHLLLT